MKNTTHKGIATLVQVEDKLMTIRNQSVLLDSDVAALYAVKTKEINQAVKNNPEKFPEGYIISLEKEEWNSLRSQIVTLEGESELITDCDESEDSRSQIVILNEGGQNEAVTNCDHLENSRSKILTLKKSGQGHNLKYPPKAFTEKGLYVLATILRGECAVRTTLAIVEAFAKIRELARTVSQLSETTEKFQQQTLMQKSGEIMADILGESMKTTDSETSVELNLAVLKFKHTVKRKTGNDTGGEGK